MPDSEAIFAALAEIFPPSRLLLRPAELAPYESDALTAYRVRPGAVVLVEIRGSHDTRMDRAVVAIDELLAGQLP